MAVENMAAYDTHVCNLVFLKFEQSVNCILKDQSLNMLLTNSMYTYPKINKIPLKFNLF